MTSLFSALLFAGLALGCGSSGGGNPSQPNAGAAGAGESAGASGVSQGGATGAGGSSLGPRRAVDKVDLLLMIDNSISMADKQSLLRDAMPTLLRQLAQPPCVDTAGNPVGASSGGVCPGGELEFPPVRDLHVAVITSSLGGFGGTVCAEINHDDHARLLGSQRAGLMSWNNSGFLAWDPGARGTPPGESNLETLISAAQATVASAGEAGCGYENSLESWYRFLVDPEPPTDITLAASGQALEIGPPDPTIVAQRAAFLRPDSALVIVMLSDENDCSIIDHGQGFLVGRLLSGTTTFHMPRSTAACLRDPNDPCCASCGGATLPAGCPAIASDPECLKGAYSPPEDGPNLRCFDQKRRFGFDLLQPLSRYVDALTAPRITNRAGQAVTNPIFAGNPPRDPRSVYLAGIVGVPWQDISDESSWTDPNRLRFLTYAELVAQNRWSVVLGSGANPPRDALMLETTADRSVSSPPHPLLNFPLAPSSATGRPNPINGHEQLINDGTDLQYACIFPLQLPRDCVTLTQACDCQAPDVAKNRPLCDGQQQTYTKVYPSTRLLQVLERVGSANGNSIVASACPKSIASPDSPLRGYNPAMSAILDRLKEALRPQ